MNAFSPEEMKTLEGLIEAGKLSRDQALKARAILKGESSVGQTPVSESEPVEPVEKTPTTVGEFTGGVVSREALTAIGGISGGVAAGLPGGALGAAGGSVLADTIEGWLRGAGKIAGPAPTMLDVASRAGQEGLVDAAFGAAGPVVWRWLNPRYWLGKISGLNSEAARTIARDADAKGLGFGASEVGGRVPKAYLRTVSVFPFAATPAVERQVVKQQEISGSIESLLNDLSPNAALTADLSIDLAKAAGKTNDEFKRVSSVLYGEFEQLAKNASVKEIVPTTNVRETATELFGEVQAGTIKIGKTALKSPRPETLEQFETYIADLQKLPENITIEQYRRLTKDLADIVGPLRTAGVDVRRAGLLKMALEKDLNEIRVDLLPGGEATAIKTALETANNWYSKGIVQFAGKADVPPGFKGKPSFETTTAGRFARSDKNVFRAGGFEAGTINEDELYRVAVNLKSPQAVSDLRSLVGDAPMRRVARKVVEDAYQQSLETVKVGSEQAQIINPEKFEQLLGLSTKNADTGQGVRALLQIGHRDIEHLKEVLDLAKRIEGLGDPSTFVRRRAMLGGVQGVLSATAGVGGAAAAGAEIGALSFAITAGGITLLSRAGSRIFTDPKSLRAMIVALDPGRDIIARRMALGRVVKYLRGPREEPEEGTIPAGIAPPLR